MLTIRTEIDNRLVIKESDYFSISYPDSDEWEIAERLRKKHSVPDGVGGLSIKFETYTDEECEEVYEPEEFGKIRRKSETGGKAIAVIVTAEDDEDPLSASIYEYIYPNDSVFVTNEHGKTVFSLIGKKI